MAVKETRSIFPNFSSQATEEEKNLSLQEKLNLIDDEIRQLYEFCSNAGYTHLQIEQCARPLLDVQNREKHIKWFRGLCCLGLVVSIIVLLFVCDPAYRQVCIYGKFVAMKALPYWDWTVIYDQDCFIENPYYVQDKLTEDDCNTCKDLQSIQRIFEADQSDIAENNLYTNTPVIVTDATKQWDAVNKFNIDFLAKMYEDYDLLAENHECQFQSTVPEYENPQDLLSALKTGELTNFQAFWENCQKEAAKLFRKYYRRPYFLPPMAEATEGNFFIVSMGQKKSLHVSWDASASWIAQIKGSSKFVLKPVEICSNICHNVRVNLEPGEILTVTNAMWRVSYKPASQGPVISFGSGVNWD
ncbi:uncharacterized protein [Acropora muricata]|uniref:uncharacterized protein isoform X1 n=1 Tax=Acropora muricata TaxID=159855 RepID=UPI0034E3F4EC